METFKDEIFLKKIFLCWFSQLGHITSEIDEEISKSLKIINEYRENTNNGTVKQPKCKIYMYFKINKNLVRKISEVDLKLIDFKENNDFEKHKSRISIENIEL